MRHWSWTSARPGVGKQPPRSHGDPVNRVFDVIRADISLLPRNHRHSQHGRHPESPGRALLSVSARWFAFLRLTAYVNGTAPSPACSPGVAILRLRVLPSAPRDFSGRVRVASAPVRVAPWCLMRLVDESRPTLVTLRAQRGCWGGTQGPPAPVSKVLPQWLQTLWSRRNVGRQQR